MVRSTNLSASCWQQLVTFGFYIFTFLTILHVSAANLHAPRAKPMHHPYSCAAVGAGTGVQVGVSANCSNATTSSPFWLANIPKRGFAAFNPNASSYRVFRNVRDYGAKGDGVANDTNAINAAIQEGARCGNGTCDSSTITPALIYFPPGTYLVSTPIIAYYYSQLIGDPLNRPTIKGAPDFIGVALIDADPYLPSGGGAQWYTNQNNFFRVVRNFILDTRDMKKSDVPTGIHWQVSQATSLQNVHFEGSQDPGRKDRGILIESGSGGFMSDLTFNGGFECAFFGNQQFMTRNVKFTNCKTAIMVAWDWQWTFKSITIENCGVGIDISSSDPATGSLSVGSVLVLDTTILDTPIGIQTKKTASSQPAAAGSLLLDNVKLQNVPRAVYNPATKEVFLAGNGETIIDLWGHGRDYSNINSSGYSNSSGTLVKGPLIRSFPKPAALLAVGSNEIFERTRPQYEDEPVSNFVSVKECGAKGDGKTDDTAALKRVFKTYANSNKIIYFDHGVYIVSDTVFIPTGTRIVGEVWAVIMADGSAFQNIKKPTPVFKVGEPGDCGMVEMSDILFETRGPQIGAILLEWNSRDPAGAQGLNGMWDVHFRVGGSAGTNLNNAECLANEVGKDANGTARITTPNPKCFAAFMLMHIGKTASVYMENVWGWTSDHALDAPFERVTIYNARGIYTESTEGPVWMYAVASEHNVLYQYQMHSTTNLFMALGQTETPYFQSNPVATGIYPVNEQFDDPTYSDCTTARCRKSWGLRIVDSSDIVVYGAGLYSFFEDYSTKCSSKEGGKSCQENMVSIEDSNNISLLNLNTIAAVNMVTVDGVSKVKGADNANSFPDTIIRFDV